MTITYLPPTIEEGKSTASVTFINEQNLTLIRSVNVPRNIDGTVDTVTLTDILEAQLRGVEQKVKVGVITFVSESVSGSI